MSDALPEGWNSVPAQAGAYFQAAWATFDSSLSPACIIQVNEKFWLSNRVATGNDGDIGPYDSLKDALVVHDIILGLKGFPSRWGSQ